MSETTEATVRKICEDFGNDRMRLMDIARAVQAEFGCVCGEAMDAIAKALKVHRVEVEGVVTFYAFLSEEPKGKIVIRVCNDIIDVMKGSEQVAEALKDELGVAMGETTDDGLFTLEETPCMGMCDQAPAILVNDVVVTYVGPDQAREMVRKLKADPDPTKLIGRVGDGNNADERINAMVHNNIRKAGEVILDGYADGEGLKKALAMTPAEVIRDVKTARLRGRGGAGFPTGMKWEFTRAAGGKKRYVLCNADEGEPGTFKDRVLLTERADMLFEGMTIAGYAIGAEEGIVYLRAEYMYLLKFLDDILAKRREKNLLGENVCGKQGFNFDIRIQIGAGAYVCGEETALISSCEGLRGDPKNRPPFPAQKGFQESPTVVNNVETFCCVPRILEKGPGWFAQMGSQGSPGTKLLSISGDCHKPGVFEVPFGISVKEMLKLCGAEEPAAVQIGGASGQMIGPDEFERTICYDDLPTGGSVMVFGPQRNILKVVDRFMDFFIEESCGYCTPCRVGNVLLKERLDRIIEGKGEPSDLEYLKDLGETVKISSRCGLGQTSPNPILTTLEKFRSKYEELVQEAPDGTQRNFDLADAVSDAQTIAGRQSVHL